jgi:hypothetical protein
LKPLEILEPAVIVIAGDVAGVVVLHPSRRMRKNVPDALAAAVLIDRAFDLVARGRGAPDEIGGKRRLLGGSRRQPQGVPQAV